MPADAVKCINYSDYRISVNRPVFNEFFHRVHRGGNHVDLGNYVDLVETYKYFLSLLLQMTSLHLNHFVRIIISN